MAGATLSTVYYDNDAVIDYLRALEERVDNMRPMYAHMVNTCLAVRKTGLKRRWTQKGHLGSRC